MSERPIGFAAAVTLLLAALTTASIESPVALRHSVVIAGRPVEEVILRDQVVIRIRGPLGGRSAQERAVTIASRLAEVLRAGIEPSSILPAMAEGHPVVMAGGKLLATVDSYSAEAQGFTQADLAVAWSNNLRAALGAARLTSSRWLNGRWRFLSPREEVAETLRGVASWYGADFHGLPTANGETYDQNALTAAHRTLPFGTRVLVTNLRNARRVLVRINDRGPFVDGRVLDLSRAAALVIDMLGTGVEPVLMEVVRSVDTQPR
jgi:rare lipoprotein A